MKFKDLTNQSCPQRILVVWELCPDVVGLWLTAGKDFKCFSSCLLCVVLDLKIKVSQGITMTYIYMGVYHGTDINVDIDRN